MSWPLLNLLALDLVAGLDVGHSRQETLPKPSDGKTLRCSLSKKSPACRRPVTGRVLGRSPRAIRNYSRTFTLAEKLLVEINL